MNPLTPAEREAVRRAVKEASEHSKARRDARTLPSKRWGNAEQLKHDDEIDRDSAVRVEHDTADMFVEFLQAALRREGAWIVFLE